MKQKTAMIELSERIDKAITDELIPLGVLPFAYEIQRVIKGELIEKEKEQIIDAHLDGQSLVSCKDEYAEQYYNETYKQD